MGYFQVRYDSRVVIYDRRAFIRLATVGFRKNTQCLHKRCPKITKPVVTRKINDFGHFSKLPKNVGETILPRAFQNNPNSYK